MAFFKSFCFCCVSHFLTFDWCLKKVSSVFPRQLSHSHTENLQLSFYYWCYWRVCIRVEPGWASLLYHAVRETLNRGRWQAPRTIVYLGREREREREREQLERQKERAALPRVSLVSESAPSLVFWTLCLALPPFSYINRLLSRFTDRFGSGSGSYRSSAREARFERGQKKTA